MPTMADMDAALEVLRGGGSMRAAAEASGLGKTQFYVCAKQEPLAARIAEARDRSAHRSRARVRRAKTPLRGAIEREEAAPVPPPGVTPEVVSAELIADAEEIFGSKAIRRHIARLERLADGGEDIDPRVQAVALKDLTVAILAPVTAERIRTPPPEEVSGKPARVVLALPPNARVPKD